MINRALLDKYWRLRHVPKFQWSICPNDVLKYVLLHRQTQKYLVLVNATTFDVQDSVMFEKIAMMLTTSSTCKKAIITTIYTMMTQQPNCGEGKYGSTISEVYGMIASDFLPA